jgi:hypothetical protein
MESCEISAFDMFDQDSIRLFYIEIRNNKKGLSLTVTELMRGFM